MPIPYKGKGILIGAILIALFLLWLVLASVLKIQPPQFYMFIHELITLPILLGQGILLLVSLIKWKQEKFTTQSYLFYSTMLLFVTTALTYGSIINDLLKLI